LFREALQLQPVLQQHVSRDRAKQCNLFHLGEKPQCVPHKAIDQGNAKSQEGLSLQTEPLLEKVSII
jgi:hypothetical protein